MAITIEEIIEIMQEDLRDMPRATPYDDGFAAGINSAIFLLKQAAKENKKNE